VTSPVKNKHAKPGRTGTKGMPRAERQRQLLDLGERAFAERGYHAVSMDEIASAAGVTKPIIYAYFGSKNGFFAAGIHRAYEDWVRRVEGAAGGGGAPAELLWRVTQAHFGWVEDSRELWPLVFGAQALGGEVAAEAARSRAGAVELIARILGQVIDAPALASELEPMAEVSVAVNMALADRWIRHPEEPREIEEARAMSILWPAIAAHV
jgi:AcrR family transcriptional regulator